MEDKEETILALESRIAVLERQLLEQRAQQVSAISSAFDALSSGKSFYGSGLILTITEIGGKPFVSPVCLRDGLTEESIRALLNNLRDSYAKATIVNPAIAKSCK